MVVITVFVVVLKFSTPCYSCLILLEVVLLCNMLIEASFCRLNFQYSKIYLNGQLHLGHSSTWRYALKDMRNFLSEKVITHLISASTLGLILCSSLDSLW